MSAPPPEPPILDNVQERPGGRSERVRSAVLAAARGELLEGGWDSFSHRATAKRAGVDPATVYRRWPTRPRLAVDALLELAGEVVPVPDTGSLDSDLRQLMLSITVVLREPGMLRLFHALSIATATQDDELRETLGGFWDEQFAGTKAMVDRGIERGEVAEGVDAYRMIELLISPLYFRALVSAQDLDDSLIDGAIEAVVAEAREGRPALSR